MELNDIKGVGPKMLTNLSDLNIHSIEDLLTYYPYRYEIFEPITLNAEYNGDRIAINAVIETTPTTAFIRKNFNKLSFRCRHSHQTLYAIIFNRAFLKPHLSIGKTITLIGKYDSKKNTFICDDIKLTPVSYTHLRAHET